MELLAEIPGIGALRSLGAFLLVLSVVVFVHELGHYLVGRWCGIRARVFSIGFGRPLLGWTDGHGTRWQIAMLPLGGYVKFVGDMDPASVNSEDDGLTEEERRVAFHRASVWRRTLTVAAGPVANFLLSIAVFAGILVYVGQPSNEPVIGDIDHAIAAEVGLRAGDRVLEVEGKKVNAFSDIINFLAEREGAPARVLVERDGREQEVTVRFVRAPRIVEVVPGTPAARAGLQPGDVFLSINGVKVESYRDVQLLTAESPPGKPMEMEILRDGRRIQVSLVPELVERAHPLTGEIKTIPTMGIRGSAFAGIEPRMVGVPLHRALWGGMLQTWRIVSGTLIYLADMLFAGADPSQLGGPIRIAEVSGDAASQGAMSLIWLIAVLSSSIGLINLLPIPVLDGGHLLFYVLEALRGRPVGETWMRIGTMVGLSLVILLMVFATYNDLARL